MAWAGLRCSRCGVLSHGFIENDADGGGQVEAAGGGLHGDCEALVGILCQQGGGQALGFAAEDEVIAGLKVLGPVGSGRLGGEVKKLWQSMVWAGGC